MKARVQGSLLIALFRKVAIVVAYEPSAAKGAGGGKPTEKKEVGAKTALPKKQDAVASRARHEAKAAMKRSVKSAIAKVKSGFSEIGTATSNEDLYWLTKWMQNDVRLGMGSFVASLARNAHPERVSIHLLRWHSQAGLLSFGPPQAMQLPLAILSSKPKIAGLIFEIG